MDHFEYRDRNLFCEDVPVSELAEKYGTPLYVYSQATLLHHLKRRSRWRSHPPTRSSATRSRPTAT
jgi:diaminopimelate decarboxylase